jgi:hypothetical protein
MYGNRARSVEAGPDGVGGSGEERLASYNLHASVLDSACAFRSAPLNTFGC